MTPAEAVRDMRITLPARGNRTLRDVVDRANHDTSLKALWHAANVNAVTRLQINDHSWVHIQIVTNIGLKLLRELRRAGVEPGMVTDYGMRQEDAEVVVVLGCLTHCLGMAIHRHGHEEMSLFLAADRLPRLLEGLYEEPEATIVQAEVLQAIISHRSDGQPLSLEAGIVRVADALDMAKGRSRIPFESGRVSIHSLSAAAIEGVHIRARPGQGAGRDRDEQLRRPLPGRQPAAVEAARLGPRGLHGHRGHARGRVREAASALVPALTLKLAPTGAEYPSGILRTPLRGRLMVGRLTLDQVVGVRVPAPQLRLSEPKFPRPLARESVGGTQGHRTIRPLVPRRSDRLGQKDQRAQGMRISHDALGRVSR